jgi:hypothetical protein
MDHYGSGPLYGVSTLPYQPGDSIEFGTVKVFSVFDSHSFGRGYYPFFPYFWGPDDTLVLMYPEFQEFLLRGSNYQKGVSVSYRPNPQFPYVEPSGSMGAPLDSFQTFVLGADVLAGAPQS